MRVDIIAVDASATPRGEGVWLDVRWRIENHSPRPLHLLANGCLMIVDGDPLVLDHSASDAFRAVSGNVTPRPRFDLIAAHAVHELSARYALPPVRPAQRFAGRFAASEKPPDPRWDGASWAAVQAWQDVIDSPPFTLR